MIDFSLSNKLTDDVIVSNDLICVLQQIDLLFDTDINDVLGDPHFGTNYDKYLYTLDVSNATLEAKVMADLNMLDLCGFTPSVVVKIIDGTYRDIAFIDITLSKDYEEYNKIYVIK